MLPKLMIVINFLAIKLALSQTIYNAAPSFVTNTVPTAQSVPANVSPLATVTIPASTVTATVVSTTASSVPLTATVLSSSIPKAITTSNMPIATVTATIPKSSVSSMPIASVSVSSTPCPTVAASYVSSPVASSKSPSATEVKAYFVPGPVPEPKVTVLAGDMPAIVEVKPRIADPGLIEAKASRFVDAGIVEVSPVCADPGYIEVTGTFCPDIIKKGNGQVKTVSSAQVDSSPMTPVKRLATACANDDPFKNSIASDIPSISKMDLIPTPNLTQKTNNNPIDFDGLLDRFMTCL